MKNKIPKPKLNLTVFKQKTILSFSKHKNFPKSFFKDIKPFFRASKIVVGLAGFEPAITWVLGVLLPSHVA